jgi:hypothetical protein
MNRSKRTALAAGVAALLSLAVALPAAAQATWKPEKPITIIVPWAAGGSTDQVTRVTAAEIEKALGQKVVVVNQPGASGSIGTKNAMEGREGRLHVDRRAPRRTSAPTRRSACSTRRSATGRCSSTSRTCRRSR